MSYIFHSKKTNKQKTNQRYQEPPPQKKTEKEKEIEMWCVHDGMFFSATTRNYIAEKMDATGDKRIKQVSERQVFSLICGFWIL